MSDNSSRNFSIASSSCDNTLSIAANLSESRPMSFNLSSMACNCSCGVLSLILSMKPLLSFVNACKPSAASCCVLVKSFQPLSVLSNSVFSCSCHSMNWSCLSNNSLVCANNCSWSFRRCIWASASPILPIFT